MTTIVQHQIARPTSARIELLPRAVEPAEFGAEAVGHDGEEPRLRVGVSDDLLAQVGAREVGGSIERTQISSASTTL